MNYNVVISHKNCWDGYSSFIICERSGRISDDAIILQDVPSASHAPRGIEGKTVIIMDVAYKYDVLKEIFLNCESVTFIDHHVSIRDDVIRLTKEINNKKITIIYDVNECGASLTWKHFNGNKKMPLFLKYIHANDIGMFDKYKDGRAFMASLDVGYKTELTRENIEKWNELFDKSTVKQMVKKGKIYLEYMESLLEQNVNKYSLMSFPSEKIYEEFPEAFKKPGEYKVAVASNPCPDASKLGNKMALEINCDFVMFFNTNLDKKEYVIMFRSKSTDVGTIASLFSGGGHKLASACSISMTKYRIEDLFMADALPRQRKY